MFFCYIPENESELEILILNKSNMDTHICPIETPHSLILQIIYIQSHIVQFIWTPHFTQQNYPTHKSKQYVPLKLPIYQLLLIFNVDLPPQGINLMPILLLILFNFLALLLTIIGYTQILPPFKVWCTSHLH